MKFAQTIARSFNTQLLGAVAVAAIMLVPVCAHAQSAADGPLRSWLDMVSASQAAQPSWMTPLVTVTPRLEQEFRWDFYDQKNGTGTQGNGQRFINYGGPGGARVELIPSYNWKSLWGLRRTCPPLVRGEPRKDGAIGQRSWSNTALSPPIRTTAITS
jgi:hypothetical protein